MKRPENDRVGVEQDDVRRGALLDAGGALARHPGWCRASASCATPDPGCGAMKRSKFKHLEKVRPASSIAALVARRSFETRRSDTMKMLNSPLARSACVAAHLVGTGTASAESGVTARPASA